MRILYDSKDPAYKTPFGTLTPGERCDLSLKIPVSCRTRAAKLCILREDRSAVRPRHYRRSVDDRCARSLL